jgi:hypothetical protein
VTGLQPGSQNYCDWESDAASSQQAPCRGHRARATFRCRANQNVPCGQLRNAPCLDYGRASLLWTYCEAQSHPVHSRTAGPGLGPSPLVLEDVTIHRDHLSHATWEEDLKFLGRWAECPWLLAPRGLVTWIGLENERAANRVEEGVLDHYPKNLHLFWTILVGQFRGEMAGRHLGL